MLRYRPLFRPVPHNIPRTKEKISKGAVQLAGTNDLLQLRGTFLLFCFLGTTRFDLWLYFVVLYWPQPPKPSRLPGALSPERLSYPQIHESQPPTPLLQRVLDPEHLSSIHSSLTPVNPKPVTRNPYAGPQHQFDALHLTLCAGA